MAGATERSILAGGCFWRVQQLLRQLPGVISTRAGYSGSDVKNATYRDHATHAEALEIMFEARERTFRELLEFFLQIHDPTTLDRQGNDRGTTGRRFSTRATNSFAVAQETISDVEASGLWPGKIVTELSPAGEILGGRA